jgi:hypothetical protein
VRMVVGQMAELAFHPPVHLVTEPAEPVRSLEAAADVVRRYSQKYLDRATAALLHQLERAATPEEAEQAGRSFRDWAGQHGLLLVPPEDAPRL